MAAVTSLARGFPLASGPSMVYFETGLLQEPMCFDTLNFTSVAKTTFKKKFSMDKENSVGALLAKYSDQL